MVNQLQQTPSNSWTTRREEKHRRIQSVQPWMQGPILSPEKIVDALELLIKSRDRIVLEGDNQKQADFLSRSLVKVDPKKLQDLHLIISSISRPEHLTLFELGIAKKVDFSFAGPQSLRLAQLLEDGKIEVGAIHTYVELYARLLIDLIPDVVLVCAEQADEQGNLYTGPNTEESARIDVHGNDNKISIDQNANSQLGDIGGFSSDQKENGRTSLPKCMILCFDSDIRIN